MRVSVNWLRDYVDIDVPIDELAQRLTMLGLEIEAAHRPGDELKDVYVGHILSIEPHPDADKLVVCRTDVGRAEALQIVCGATNMSVGDKVPTAVVGATLAGGFEITRRKMRGIESFGMMCSAQELGLGEDDSGLLIMAPDSPVGADVKPLLGLDDVIFEIEVIPNRGDWASMIGVARELAAFYGKELRVPKVNLEESGRPASEYSSVTNDAPDLCPRYIGRVLTGLKIAPSPPWLCQRLVAAGQRPINNVVDVTNYVLLETGHPLHAFDYDNLAEHRIVVRRAAPGETMPTLDGEMRTLTQDMLVIADAAKPQAVAGIMGGENSEVGERTTTVFLESAYFNPVSIRRTSRALGLATESSQRFQRGADPVMAEYAVNRAAQLMQELASAQVAPGLLDAYPEPVAFPEIHLRYARTNLLLGVHVPEQDQRTYLARLGFQITDETPNGLTVRVPTWRHDAAQEADLIEEVARFYGYDRLDAALPHVRPSDEVIAPEDAPIRALRRSLVGLGLTELINWTFTSAEDVQRTGLSGEFLHLVALANPLSENQAAMRSSLLPGLLANAAYNINRGALDLAAFEIGPVYAPATGHLLPSQRAHVAILLSGVANPRHWGRTPRSVDLYDLKGYAEALCAQLGPEAEFQTADLPTFQPGQAAEIRLNGQPVGRLGKVAHAILAAYDIEQDVYLLELNLQPFLPLERPNAPFENIPAFPPSVRDMALIVDADLPAGELQATALQAGGKFLQFVQIFDVYSGDQIPTGKKSVALNLVFQSPERTLTDKHTNKSIQNILKRMKNKFQAELR